MKIVFLSFKTLLDRNSGAALELRTILEGLSSPDTTVQAFSFNCYDTGDEYYFDEETIDKRLSPNRSQRRLFHYDQNGVRHYLFVGSSKDTKKITQKDLEHFLNHATFFLRNEKPDIIIFFGSNELLPLLRLGKNIGSRIVFYTGTASYQRERQPLFDLADNLVVPSRFIGELYRQRFGVDYKRIPTILPFDPIPPSPEIMEARRQMGFITLVNPTVDKGGHFFFHLSQAPKMKSRKFLCVESRSSRKSWRNSGINIDNLQNLYWVPWQEDIKSILHNSAILTMPSLIEEAAGKVISEAMGLGVPCLGFDIGGIKEQIGAGGTTIPFDERLSASPDTALYNLSVLSEPIEKWVEKITEILDSREAYKTFSKSAIETVDRFNKKDILASWKDMLNG